MEAPPLPCRGTSNQASSSASSALSSCTSGMKPYRRNVLPSGEKLTPCDAVVARMLDAREPCSAVALYPAEASELALLLNLELALDFSFTERVSGPCLSHLALDTKSEQSTCTCTHGCSCSIARTTGGHAHGNSTCMADSVAFVTHAACTE